MNHLARLLIAGAAARCPAAAHLKPAEDAADKRSRQIAAEKANAAQQRAKAQAKARDPNQIELI